MTELLASSSKRHGFTLIELVIVIVLVGILAIVALPRFIDLSSDARQATMLSAASAIRDAAQLAHLKAVIGGIQDQTTSSLVIDGVTINFQFGYPDGTSLENDLLILPPGSDYIINSSAAFLLIYPGAAAPPFPLDCLAAYTAPATLGDEPNYFTDVSNCN